MRLQIDADDETAFEAARDELLERFTRWAGSRGLRVTDEAPHQALHMRFHHGDGDLGQLLLEALPEDAADVAQRLRDVPGLRPLATLWLVERGLASPETLDPPEAAELFVETLAALLAAEGPDAMAEAMAADAPDDRSVLDVVDGLWRVGTVATGEVLDGLTQSDDRTLAKAARRALFKYRGVVARK